MGDGIVAGGILRDGCDDRAFGKIQIPDAFAEIAPGSGLHAQGVLPQIDGIHIVFQDHVLVHLLFQLDGQILLLDLALQLIREAALALACPRGQHIVLDELLGNGARALGKFSGGEAHIGRAQDAPQVDAVMLVKTLVLDGHKSMSQILRDVLHADRDPVGALRVQLGGLVSLRVVDEGGKAGRRHVNVGHVRHRRKDTLHKTQPAADTDHADGEDETQKNLKNAKGKPVAPFF